MIRLPMALCALVVALSACDASGALVAPDRLDVQAPSLAHAAAGANAVVAAATGSGHATFGLSADGRRFAFSAVQRADGSVSGEYQLTNTTGVRIHGSVTCLTVVGNEVRIGGIAGQTNVDGWAGTRNYFTVVDNGQGAGAPADQISFLVRFVDGTIPSDELHCADGLGPGLFDIERGNITVH